MYFGLLGCHKIDFYNNPPNQILVIDKKKGGLKQTAFLAMILLLKTETTVETINTSAGVNQLLLTGVERMALRANFNTDFGLSGTSVDNLTASAGDGAIHIVGMDSLFHSFHLFLVNDCWGHA